MEILKKNYVRVLAVLMAVVISVSTPISDFADTQGIHETEAAAATTLITVAKLFGAIAGAYGIYIASDKLADLSEEWVTWTSTHNSEAYNDLQSIKQGVVGYVITRFLAKSVADYLKTKTAPSAYYTVKGEAYGLSDSDWTLPDNSYTNSFYKNVVQGSMSTSEPVMIRWDHDSTYSSGIYTYYYFYPTNSWWKKNYYENENAEFYAFHIPTQNGSFGARYTEQMCVSVFDNAGLPIAFKRLGADTSYEVQKVQYYYDGALGWRQLKGSVGLSERFNVAEFETGYFDFCQGLGVTSLERADTGASADKIMDNLIRVKSVNVDYSVHGNTAVANTEALVGSEVTEEKLVAIQNVSSEAYESWLESQQNNEDSSEEDDPNLNLAMNALLASAIASAVTKELKDMGIVENPTDTPSEGVVDAVNSVVDAVKQVGTKIQSIAEGIASIPSVIAESIRSVFEELFIPDEAAITDAVLELSNEFSFFNSLTSVVDDIGDSLSNASGPPEIYIHFEDAEDSKYTPVGTIKLLSFEWYEPYKPYGDALLSSMMILFFLWRIRKRLSDMIQGVSSSDVSESKGGNVNGN